jgi:putative NADH-flavin reductase
MKVTLFGATGAVGGECLKQCLEAGHAVTALVRTPAKLPPELRERIDVVEGDGLDPACVAEALGEGTDAVLFAIGVDMKSGADLCTKVTRNILEAMREKGVRRFVFCGGGSTIVAEDQVTLGARIVELLTRVFMGLRHRDKEHQLELLESSKDIDWLGVRPLQMRRGPARGEYRIGFHPYSGLSKISFADCAHAMVGMLGDDTWLHKAPIVQY